MPRTGRITTAALAVGILLASTSLNLSRRLDNEILISDLGVYTIGFFLFWLIAAVSGIGTLYFAITNCMRRNPGYRDK